MAPAADPSMSPSRPRILLLLDSLAPGGAERSTVALLPLLIERGFDLELATLHDREGLQAEVADAGVELRVLAGPGGRLGWVRRTHQLLRSSRPDLLHTSLFESDVCGRTAALAARTPVVTTLPTERYGAVHLAAPHLRASKVRLSQAADVATARIARRIHAVSDHVADTMAEHLRYPRDRIDVVHRGRPRPEALPDGAPCRKEVRRDLGLDDEDVILLVSRHEQAKGIDRLLEAVPAITAHRPDAVVLIAGRTGGHTAELEALAAGTGAGDHIRFLGHRDDVTALHRAADVFVLPSRREGLPGSLLEAMAAGTPAVVNGLPQVREVVDDTEALIVDAADPEALASAVVDSLTDRTAAEARATAAESRFSRQFTLDRSADGMAEFYRRALGVDAR